MPGHPWGFNANYRELIVNFYSEGNNLFTCQLVYLSTALITKKVENTKALRKLGDARASMSIGLS